MKDSEYQQVKVTREENDTLVWISLNRPHLLNGRQPFPISNRGGLLRIFSLFPK